ncbi:MAG: hypothetical protein IJK77_00310 [Lachnospiraceae bacterium]|nr:hypothetical protein [Lachnospiraceae bacterium]
MSTGRKKLIILAAVFVLAFAIGMIGAPEEKTQAEDGGSAMTAASLPVLCASFGDRLINPLYGYTEDMDAASLADSVYPFADSLDMTVTLLDGAVVPKSVSWEVRDEAGGRLIERGSTSVLQGSRSECSFSLSLQDLYEDETYYRLRFTVEMEDITGRYYTRIRKVSAENLEALTEYALAFHDAQFDKEAAAGYAAKLEPNDQADRGTLAYVDIHCSLDQVSWGDSGVTQSSQTWMTVQAVHGTYGYFRFDYLAQVRIGRMQPAVLRCRETMTLQKNREAMYLLEYERHTNQVWEANEDTVSAKGFLFGIQEEGSAEAVTAGDLTAFTVNGDLWCCDRRTDTLTRIFSFRRRGEHELRTLQSDCSIRIMSVDKESGQIEFVVSGYMNGGSREGMSGAVCYTFDPNEGTLTEIIAIASDKSPEMAERDVEQLFARGGGHFLYFCMNRQITAVDLTSGETAVLVSRSEFDSLVQSDDRTLFAWQSGSDRTFPGAVHVMDLKTGTGPVLEAGEDEFIRTLGFIRNDLIVGCGKRASQPLDDGAGGRYPFYALEIFDEDLNSIMNYSFPGTWISGIEIDSEKIIVHCYALKEDVGYTAKEDDVLLRSDSDVKTSAASVSTYKHETLKRVTMLAMSKLPSYVDLTLRSGPVLREGRRLPPAGSGDAFTGCYAWSGGNYLGAFETAGKAIAAAAPDYGYVIDAATGRLVWCWSVRKNKVEVSPGAIRTDLPQSLDLHGASFRNLQYFLDAGIPIRWTGPDHGEVWIIGCDRQNVLVYDSVSGESSRIPLGEVEEAILRDDNYLRVFTD